MIVDDYIPCINKQACFSKSIKGQNLFIMILEKAFAKLYGSYYRLESGLAFQVMRDLTGAPSYEWDIKLKQS